MCNGIVIYRSKYGASKKYAAWIASQTGFDCIESSKARIGALTLYQTVIFCGGIYASGIAGLSFLRKHYQKLQDKKLAVFCVGASAYNEKAFEEIKARNLKEDLNVVPLFYGRGAWNEQAMNLKDRALCRLLQKAAAKLSPSDRESWMEDLLCASGQACDWTDETYLKPLMEYIRES